MPADCVVTLQISEAPGTGAPAFFFHVDVDGQPIATNQPLSADASKTVRELARAYVGLFERRTAPQLTREGLQGLGAHLFDVWLKGVWDQLQPKFVPGCRRVLVVASDVADVLNLPWELLRPPGGDHLGADAKYTVRRLPWSDRKLAAVNGPLRPRPLRVLFMACAPQDLPLLDYEREEEFLLTALAKVGPNAVFDSDDLGTFEELRQRINEFQPHVVHLSGHGAVLDGLGHFAFENEEGTSDLRSSQEIGQLFAGSDVQCAFVSGCQTGQAPQVAALGGVCQGLIGEGVPLAVGWAASIADDMANLLARTFYGTVAAGQPVDRALVQGRQAVRPLCEQRGDPSWSLPVLYAATTQGLLFDPDPQRPPASAPKPSLVLQALPGMTKGYAQHFIGRRREQQRLLPGLRSGEVQCVLLTGLGGAGKSTLATRLTRKLEADGFTPIAVSATPEKPLDAARLLETCGDAFLDAGLGDDHAKLRNAQLPEAERLRAVVRALNRGRFILVLDNFEVNLDERTRRVISPELAGFYRYLLDSLSGGSRVIITSRYPPADVDPLPPTAREETLRDFPEASFLKFMLREPAVERRYYAGELPHDLLIRLHRLLGGTPRFLEQIRTVLATIKPEDLAAELDRVELPADAEPGKLRAARDAYCESIFTERLYGRLDADSRRALSRAAVYGVAVTVDGLAAAAGAPVERVRALVPTWRSYALVCPEVARGAAELWSVYGMLRGWLLAPKRLSADERRAAHRAAADFLVEFRANNREAELGLSWVECLLEARAQYLAAEVHDRAREVTGRISHSYRRQGLYSELERLNREVAEHEEHPTPLVWIGRSHAHRANYGEARGWYDRALQVAGEDEKQAATVWHELATIDLKEGHYAAARDKFGQSLAITQRIGDRADEAATCAQLTNIDILEGRYAAAREKSRKALAAFQEIGDRAGEAATWHQLATIDLNEGHYAAARDKFSQSLAIKQQIGDRADEAATCAQLTSIDILEGRYAAAREKSRKALAAFQEIGDRAGEATTWHNLATIDLHEGHYAAARDKLDRALATRQQIGDRAGEAATWHQLATIYLNEGHYAAAREKFGRALAICQQIGDRAGEARAWHQLATIDLNEGHYAAAREKLATSRAIKQEIGDRAGEAATWHQLATIDLTEGQYGAARDKFGRALAICQQIGDRYGEAAAFFQLGSLAAQQDRLAQGARLVALCYLIDKAIGHGDTDKDFRALADMAARLDYSPEQLAAISREVWASYQADRGKALLWRRPSRASDPGGGRQAAFNAPEGSTP